MTFPNLHEQDATGAWAYTSASWLGWDLVCQLGEEWFSSNLGQVRHGAGVGDKFLQGGHYGGASKEFAKEVDLAPKLIVRDGLDEFLGGGTRGSIKFGDLRGGRAGDAKGFAFASKLRNQAHSLCASCVHSAPGEKQIPHECIAKIAFQARDTAEAGDESQTQLGEGEARHLVGDDDVASQGELKPSAKADAVNGGNGHERCGVDRV